MKYVKKSFDKTHEWIFDSEFLFLNKMLEEA